MRIIGQFMAKTVSSTTSETKQICEFVTGTIFDDLPEEVVEHAKNMLIDTIAVTLAGTDTEAASIVRDTYTTLDGKGGDARTLGTGEVGSTTDVAFLTGVMSHALDFDDVHSTMGGHPSAPVLSALLPVAERVGATGSDLIRSFVLGTEVEITLANVLNPGHYERGWHPTAILGTIGAATATGAVLNLDTRQLQHALGIAASQASGIKGNFGTMTKPLHVGNAARSGQEAAELAARGFTANERILEVDFGGFCDLFQGEPAYDFDNHFEKLGSPWSVLDPPVGFKPYPCCGSTHSAIDAALKLRDRYDVSPEDIETVRIQEHPRRLDHTNKPRPQSSLNGKFSVQYCVTVALHEGGVWLDHFDDVTVQRDKYQTFLNNIEVCPDRSNFEDREWGASVTIDTGVEEHTITIDAPKGSAERPLTREDLERKYRRCASIALDDNIERSLRTIKDLETVDEVSHILNILV